MVVPYSTGYLVRSLVRVPGSGNDRQADPVMLDLSNVSPLAATVPVSRTVPSALSRTNQVTPPPPSPPSGKLTSNAPLLSEASSAAAAGASPVNASSLKREREEGHQYQSSTPAAKVPRKDSISSGRPEAPSQLGAPVSHPRREVLHPTAQRQEHLPLQVVQVAIALPVVVPQQAQSTAGSNRPQHRVVLACNGVRIVTAEPSSTYQATAPPSPVSDGCSTEVLLEEVNNLKRENEELNERLKKFQNIFRNKDTLRYLANRILQAN
ncbi:uncharacterized protein [Macrobrachium rosenbergii]|uniref:uncharacterized protein n=1 Tax=Macrobrachium rosenbergii TaxID=79674 RepID=UPI0034D6AE75